jgi:NAD(P)-dependent dehydrogenase (short-subunit alcohol dehydrogenase family)
MSQAKTVIVTGASQGIGAAVAGAFLERGYSVVGTSRGVSKAGAFKTSPRLKLVDGDVGDPETAARVTRTAIETFGAIDALVNNAGIFFLKPFTEFTQDDFKRLVSTNLDGFLYMTQLSIRQMLAQKTGGSVVTITAALADNPIAGVKASVPMITKGGLNTVTRALASEYAKEGVRVNAVAPGIVDTPLHKDSPKDFLKTLSPMGVVSDAKEIANAVLFLTESATVTGEVLHVDGGSHLGKW